MNIFVFVSTLLLIIGISTHSLIEKGRLGLFVPKSYKGYMIASRDVQGQEEKYYYKKAPKPKQKKETQEKKFENPIAKEKEKNKSNETNFENIHFDSRINIWPLFSSEKASCKDLYEITAELFRVLYSKQSFFEKGMEYEILNNLIEEGKKLLEKEQTICLEKIKLSSPLKQMSWYKMLKGTKKYKTQKDKGFDSILEYIELFPSKTTKIYLPLASNDLLTTLFNQDIANEIMKTQNIKGKYKAIDEEKVRQIATKHHFISNRANFWDFLTFNKTHSQSSLQPLSSTDKDTQICFKKTLHSAS